MYPLFPNSHLYSAVFISTCFRLKCGTETHATATGFYVQNKHGKLCLVTNRHVFDPGYSRSRLDSKFVGATLESLTTEVFSAPGGKVHELPMQRSIFEIVNAAATLIFAQDEHEDVACIISPQIIVRAGNSTVDYYVKSTEFADDSWFSHHLSVCDFVVFPGFPEWHDRYGKRPILRTGTISSDPRTNYSDKDKPQGRRVAYEAFSFSGSSGSPIFCPARGFAGAVSSSDYREGRIIGINVGHFFEPAHNSHSGISYFIKSSAILELINRPLPAASLTDD